MELQGLLSTPWIAVLLGFALGVILVAPLFWTSRLLTADNADLGTFVVMAVVFGGLIVSLGMMWAYRLVTETGFLFFGPSVVAGFVVTLGALAIVMTVRLLKSSGSAAKKEASDVETRR